MDLQAILDAIGTNPSLIDGLIQPIMDSDKGKTYITNRLKTEVDAVIGEKIKEVHDKTDAIVLELLGRKPKDLEGGKKQKSYDMINEILKEHKELLEKKDLLEKDPAIEALKKQVEELQKKGGGELVQKLFDQSKADWLKEKEELTNQITTLQGEVATSGFKNQIATAIAGIKFKDGIDESLQTMIKSNAEAELLKNVKSEGGKIIFYDADGKAIVNKTTYEPATAEEVLANLPFVKAVIGTAETGGGGGAATEIQKGSIKTIKVEGKDDTKKLVLPAGSFTTKSQFIEVAEKALIESGITRRDEDWDKLKNAAYTENEVDKLPD